MKKTCDTENLINQKATSRGCTNLEVDKQHIVTRTQIDRATSVAVVCIPMQMCAFAMQPKN